jgi:hypothetical protein
MKSLPAGSGTEGSPLLIFDTADVLLMSRMGELQDKFTILPIVISSGFVNPSPHFPPKRDTLIPVDRGVVRQYAPANAYRYVRRDDRSHAARGELSLEIDSCSGSGTVVIINSPGDTRAKKPVFSLKVIGGKGLEYQISIAGHISFILRSAIARNFSSYALV